MRNDKDNLIVELSFEFALRVIAFSEELHALRRFDMARQIFRAGTSIGANVREAQNAESKADFIHKFKIAAKEADELIFWLKLCEHSEYYPNPSTELVAMLNRIIKVVSKIIASSKKR